MVCLFSVDASWHTYMYKNLFKSMFSKDIKLSTCTKSRKKTHNNAILFPRPSPEGITPMIYHLTEQIGRGCLHF